MSTLSIAQPTNTQIAIIGTSTIDSARLLSITGVTRATDTIPAFILVSHYKGNDSTLTVVAGLAVRSGFKLDGEWVTTNDGYFYSYDGYLDADFKPFAYDVIVWQAKPLSR